MKDGAFLNIVLFCNMIWEIISHLWIQNVTV